MSGFRVVCDGGVMQDGFDTLEDAKDYADGWNHAYPPEQGYPEFTVEPQP